MRRLPLLAAALGVSAVLVGTGCGGSNVCDRSDALDTATLVGDCQVAVDARVLGAKSSCNSALSACSAEDKKALEDMMGCWEKLPVCASASESAWTDQANGCYAKADGVSQACKDAFFQGGPGIDAGADAGPVEPPDAGPQPDMDGTGALDIVSTSNATQVAFAWTSSQPGNVDHWEVHRFTAADLPEDPIILPNAKEMYFSEDIGMGLLKKYYVVGLTADNAVVQGFIGGEMPEMDAGMEMDGGMDTDAGMTCMDNFECNPDMVCNLGQCQTLTCTSNTPGMNPCPTSAGYECDLTKQLCTRTAITKDGGIDAGMEDGGMETESKPFISELVQISTQNPTFSEDREVSPFAATNIDMVAMDTAHQFMVMEQEGQLFGYYTEDRGKTFRLVPIDNNGSHPKLAYEPVTHTLYTCYNAFGGVRVRRSSDYGKTWKTSALDLVNMAPDDGGSAIPVQDCDVAPWRDGQALVTAIDSDTVKLWTIKPDGTAAGNPQIVFTNSATQFAPQEPTIATLPDDFMIHVLFSVTRKTTQNTTDKEVVGMYRDMSSNGFVGPKSVNIPNVFDQTSPAVAIDPVTKQGVAAFVSKESGSGGPLSETVYISFWVPSKQLWATGSDLNVFVQDKNFGNYVVMTDRTQAEDWEARAPSLGASKDGTITLGFLAGKAASSSGIIYNPWSVKFSFNADNVIIGNGAKGWFVPPAKKVSTTRVAHPASRDAVGPVVVSDPQISTYYGFVEAVGTQGEVPNRPLMVSNPK